MGRKEAQKGRRAGRFAVSGYQQQPAIASLLGFLALAASEDHLLLPATDILCLAAPPHPTMTSPIERLPAHLLWLVLEAAHDLRAVGTLSCCSRTLCEVIFGERDAESGLESASAGASHLCMSMTSALLARLCRGPLRGVRGLSLAGCGALRTLTVPPTLIELDLSRCDGLDDGALAALRYAPLLRVLRLSTTPVAAEDLAHLAALPALSSLALDDCSVGSEDSLAELSGLTALTSLDLTRTGADVATVRSLPRSVRRLRLDGCAAMDDAALEAVGRLADLEELGLALCRAVTDEGLAHLAGLGRLTHLDLARCRGLSPACGAHLAQLKSLRELRLTKCRWARDEALAAVTALPALTRLDLSMCVGVTDEGIRALARLPALEDLSLTFADGLSDAGLVALARTAARLTRLDVASCRRVTDRGVASVAGIEGLRELSLERCSQVTDDGAACLHASRALRRVDLRRTDVSSAAVGALRAALWGAVVLCGDDL